MSERIHRLSLANESEARSNTAKEIRDARREERGELIYPLNRGFEHYLNGFSGFRYLLEFAKMFPPEERNVLDIGAGRMIAIAQLAQRSIGEGLHFYATALTRSPIADNPNPRLTPILTSAETLRGINKESIAVALSYNGLAFSKEPSLAIERIDEVLAPGGVVKATFRTKGAEQAVCESRLDFQTYERFVPLFEDLGYDLAILPSQDPINNDVDVVLAVKPGRPSIPAQALLDVDKKDTDEYHEYSSATVSAKGKHAHITITTSNRDHGEWIYLRAVEEATKMGYTEFSLDIARLTT